ncbi:MAG TPA: hypothetical protein VHM20_06970, partial [Gammaproteobacteria bacterium]|nr:hypothetical protein [Gammaproteobacteria bacterium]
MLKKCILLLVIFLNGCHSSSNTPAKTIKVEASQNTQTLYYSGIIEPILAYTIQNINADGVVKEKYFEYGTHI